MIHPEANCKNEFKVPKRAWGSWTHVGQHTFNKLYQHMIENQMLYKAPGVSEDFPDVWKITAWNAAWMAASIVSRGERHLIKDITPRYKATRRRM